jgi:hypothetical protein
LATCAVVCPPSSTSSCRVSTLPGANLSRRLFQLIRLPGGQKDPRAFFRHGERRRAANRAAAAENHHGLIFKQHEERLMWEWISKVWVKK